MLFINFLFKNIPKILMFMQLYCTFVLLYREPLFFSPFPLRCPTLSAQTIAACQSSTAASANRLAASPTGCTRGRPGASNARRSHNLKILCFSSHHKHEKRHPIGCLFYVVAGVGFEPHDLRVMSPTSYQLLYPAI